MIGHIVITFTHEIGEFIPSLSNPQAGCLDMPPRGRPRRHQDDRARWRAYAARRRGQQENRPTLTDSVPYFLFYDPRAIPEPRPADEPAGTFLDNVHEALDATLLPRETDLLSITSALEPAAELVFGDEDVPGLDDEQPNTDGLLSGARIILPC